MITMPLLVFAALYMALLVWLCRKLKNWPTSIAVTLLMLSPVIYWIGTYQYVQYEHKVACERDGGLKVLIEPEKADRIQLDPDSFDEGYAKGFLRMYSPQLAVVEAWDGEYTGKGQKTGYFVYSMDPATTALEKKNWQFNKFNKVPLAEATSGTYVLRKAAKIDSDLTATRWTLERNGQVYATWTSFYHYWSKNPGMPIGWQCFHAGSPEALDKDANQVLIELILK
jgi:hypothetical protein